MTERRHVAFDDGARDTPVRRTEDLARRSCITAPVDPVAPVIDGVRIVRRIAVGGMAEVFVGQREGATPSLVVIKRLLPGADAAWAEMFAREREILRAIDSPHIVRCLGGRDDYTILEYVDGADLGAVLASRMKRGLQVPLAAAVTIADALARALTVLHQRGIVHRDVNPANVLLGRDGAVKLADLGVAHTDASKSIAGIKGTLAYMAPEQLAGGATQPASDVYAAGLIAYEMLTGVAARPAGMVGVAELLVARRGLPSAPSQVRPELPPALDQVVLGALAPDPGARPDPDAWRVALQQASGANVDGAAVSACIGSIGPVATPVRTLADVGPRAPAATPDRGVRSSADVRSTRSVASQSATRVGWRPRVVVVVLLFVAALAVAAAVSQYEPRGPAVSNTVASVAAPSPGVTPSRVELREPSGDPRPTVAGAVADAGQPPTPAPRRSRPRRARAPGHASVATSSDRAVPDAGVRASVLLIRGTVDSPVHVSGGGASGLAPQRTAPLVSGATTLALVVGRATLRTIVRVSDGAEGLTMMVGAPAGAYYDVDCGSRAGPTPLHGISLSRPVTCTVASPDGRRGRFAMALER